MGYFEGDEWLDGPQFCAWLDEHGYAPAYVSKTLARQVVDWRNGMRAPLLIAEPLVIALGCVAAELPGGVWAADQSYRREERHPRGVRPDLCRKGHPLAGDNVYAYPDGRYECRCCRRERKQRELARRREAVLA